MGLTKRQKALKAKRVIARIVGLQVGDKVRVNCSGPLRYFNGVRTTVKDTLQNGLVILHAVPDMPGVDRYMWSKDELQLLID